MERRRKTKTEDQDLPSIKKHKPPQEPAKAAIPHETGREGKEKEKRKKVEGEGLPPPQANTIIRYLTTQANKQTPK
jgi:hypothetical protein